MEESYIFVNKENNFEMFNSNKSINFEITLDDYFEKNHLINDCTEHKINNVNINNMLCSQYLNVNHKVDKHQFNYISIFIQLAIVIFTLFFNLSYIWSCINILNIFMIDSVFSAIIFILQYYSYKNGIENYEKKYYFNKYLYQTPYVIRLYYYFIILSIYYIFNIITWFFFSPLLQFIILFFTLPCLIENIVYSYEFKKITMSIDSYLENFVYLIISKQLGKVIKLISRNCLMYEPEINDDEFKPFVRKISINTFINFICSFLFATLLHYFEKNGTTFFTAIFRQIYFRQYYFQKEKIQKDDKKYIIDIMKKKNWSKLLDSFTLNKFLHIYLELEQDDDNSIIKHLKDILEQIISSFNKIMVCWTVSSLFKINGSGVIFFYIFTKSKSLKNMILKTIVTTIFVIFSYYSYEQLLQIILCEITTRLLVNRFSQEILYDFYKYIKKLLFDNTILYIENNTIILSSYLAISTISYSKTNIIFTLGLLSLSLKIYDFINKSDKNKRLFFCIINTIIFGYLSNYNIIHCLILPFFFQFMFLNNKINKLIKKKLY